MKFVTTTGKSILCCVTFLVSEVRRPIIAMACMSDSDASFILQNGQAAIVRGNDVIQLSRKGNLFYVPFVFFTADEEIHDGLIGTMAAIDAARPSIAKAVFAEDWFLGYSRASASATTKTLPQRLLLSKEQFLWHKITNLPYADWCESCIRDRGRENPPRGGVNDENTF